MALLTRKTRMLLVSSYLPPRWAPSRWKFLSINLLLLTILSCQFIVLGAQHHRFGRHFFEVKDPSNRSSLAMVLTFFSANFGYSKLNVPCALHLILISGVLYFTFKDTLGQGFSNFLGWRNSPVTFPMCRGTPIILWIIKKSHIIQELIGKTVLTYTTPQRQLLRFLFCVFP